MPNITILNCAIDLNRTYTNTFGIYSNSTHSTTAPTTSATATTVTGGNHNLIIWNNNITDVNQGIVVVGPTAAADQNTGLIIGSTALNGNTITNFGTGAQLSSFANVSGTMNGILVRNSNGYNLSYNSVTSSAGAITTGTLRGIYKVASTNAPTNTFTNTVSNNTISIQGGGAGVGVNGIILESTNASVSSSLIANSNNFINLNHSVAATAAITALSNTATHLNVTINSNTFTNLTTNTTGSFTFISNSVTRPANSVCTVTNNSIVTGFSKPEVGTVTFYTSNGSTPSTGSETNSGNNFSNITLTGSTIIGGWGSTDGSTATPFGPTKQSLITLYQYHWWNWHIYNFRCWI
ncbi:MAG: hypothetical protein IPP34_18650 [Bacteroidetes bacterium]|nr:hypothetical protein [Bacteroidota bacterium]